MASRRTDIIVTWLAFAVAVGLELFAVSASERSAPQKRGMKNTKVPRRLKTAANALNYTTPSQSIHTNEWGKGSVDTD